MIEEGDIVLTPIPQANGRLKNRPAVVLREVPPFGDLLVCGVSTQLQQAVPNFDEIISHNSADFRQSGLVTESVIRLGFLAIVPRHQIPGTIGQISTARHHRLLISLSRHLTQHVGKAE